MTRYDVVNTEVAGVCVVERTNAGPRVHLSNVEAARAGIYASFSNHPSTRSKHMDVYLLAKDYLGEAEPGEDWINRRPWCRFNYGPCMSETVEGSRYCEQHARDTQ